MIMRLGCVFRDTPLVSRSDGFLENLGATPHQPDLRQNIPFGLGSGSHGNASPHATTARCTVMTRHVLRSIVVCLAVLGLVMAVISEGCAVVILWWVRYVARVSGVDDCLW